MIFSLFNAKIATNEQKSNAMAYRTMANLLDDEKALGGISTIMMHYTNGDYTSYTLTDISEGAKLDNSLFAIKK